MPEEPDNQKPKEVELNALTFGYMMGKVEATHDNVKDIKESNKAQDQSISDNAKRITAIEARNENIKSRWKTVRWVSVSAAGVWSFFKMLGGL